MKSVILSTIALMIGFGLGISYVDSRIETLKVSPVVESNSDYDTKLKSQQFEERLDLINERADNISKHLWKICQRLHDPCN